MRFGLSAGFDTHAFFHKNMARNSANEPILPVCHPFVALTLNGILGIFRLALLGLESSFVDWLIGEIEYDIVTSSS